MPSRTAGSFVFESSQEDDPSCAPLDGERTGPLLLGASVAAEVSDATSSLAAFAAAAGALAALAWVAAGASFAADEDAVASSLLPSSGVEDDDESLLAVAVPVLELELVGSVVAVDVEPEPDEPCVAGVPGCGVGSGMCGCAFASLWRICAIIAAVTRICSTVESVDCTWPIVDPTLLPPFVEVLVPAPAPVPVPVPESRPKPPPPVTGRGVGVEGVPRLGLVVRPGTGTDEPGTGDELEGAWVDELDVAALADEVCVALEVDLDVAPVECIAPAIPTAVRTAPSKRR